MARGPENQRTREHVTAKPRSKLPLGGKLPEVPFIPIQQKSGDPGSNPSRESYDLCLS